MLEAGFSGLPVVDAHGRLVGILTEGDLLRRAETGTERQRSDWLKFLLGPGRLAEEFAHANARKVDEVMTTEVESATEHTSLDKIVETMEHRHVKRVPIVRDGAIVGIVSRADLVRALAKAWSNKIEPPLGDNAIRARILAGLDKQGWAPRSTVNVTVKDGVVDLTGSILDERERAALRVLAESAPGVRSVTDHRYWIEPLAGWVIEPPAEKAE